MEIGTSQESRVDNLFSRLDMLNSLGSHPMPESIEANKGYTFEEQFKQLYELSDNPKRKEFLDDLFQFMADRNQPVNRIPIMAKQVLDLYELYNLVVARGGLVEVINKKIWREITKGLNLPSSITSAAFTLRTQYMKYLYPYECAKNNFSHQDELQQAIDGNRREGRRAGGYAPYLGQGGAGSAGASGGSISSGGVNGAGGDPSNLGQYSASPNLLAAAAAAQAQAHAHHAHVHTHAHHAHVHAHGQHQQHQQQQQHHPLQLHQDPRDQLQQRPGGSSGSASSSVSPSASPSTSLMQQRLYQDSIESDHDDDEGSIDLSRSPKRASPIVGLEHQHLDSHNHHINQQQAAAAAAAAEQQQQQLAAATAAALRQQLGAAINFAGSQNFLGQFSSQTGNPNSTSSNPTPNPNSANMNPAANNTAATNQQPDLLKQQQEQFLAALMAATHQQQQPPQQQTQTGAAGPANSTSALPPDQQAAARAALSMMASNAMLIAASNAPDAMAVAAAAQAIGVKGAFIILLL